MDVARVHDVIEETDGVMNVFAGERIVESFLLGAVGYVNPYGNYIPRASSRIWDFLTAGRIDDAKRIQRLINQIDHVIAAGHPTYGHQCYSKALAAEAGYPVGDVRPPLTTFAELGEEGRERRDVLTALMRELDELMDELDGAPVAAAASAPSAAVSRGPAAARGRRCRGAPPRSSIWPSASVISRADVLHVRDEVGRACSSSETRGLGQQTFSAATVLPDAVDDRHRHRAEPDLVLLVDDRPAPLAGLDDRRRAACASR